MSMLVSRGVMDIRTMRDIDARDGCGCHFRDPKWFICDYHEGYDAAVEQHASGYPSVTNPSEEP
jgi:hypothetical protein